MSEVENLLRELQNMKSDNSKVQNSKETWYKISQMDLAGLGFTTEEELKAWIENNPYSSLI